MLGLVDSQRSLLIFLGVATLIALGALLAPGTVWLLDVSTAIVAAAAAFMACTRLALGALNAAARAVCRMAVPAASERGARLGPIRWKFAFPLGRIQVRGSASRARETGE